MVKFTYCKYILREDTTMRKDGRDYNQIREITYLTDFSKFTDGSILLSFGSTKVLCNASISDGVPDWILKKNNHHGWLTAEYSMLPQSSSTRNSREIIRPRGRTQEIQRLIGRSLRACIDLRKMINQTITIDCDVIQADGGTRTTAINGGFLAMSIAVQKHLNSGKIVTNPIFTQIAAISVGIIDSSILLDLNYEEDRNADVDANIVMNNENEFIEIQSTAERGSFSRDNFDKILSVAKVGIDEILFTQNSILNDYFNI